jgi:agarase
VRLPPADGIIAAAGRHVDVLSVNCYARSPDPQAFSEWHRVSGGRPILIGEFHFPLASARQLPPLWEAFPEAEREGMFATFVEGWARQPWSIGCHWYQHADQPVLGRHLDGENQTVGLVDLTDTPYEHLVRAIGKASAGMYAWHATPRPAT